MLDQLMTFFTSPSLIEAAQQWIFAITGVVTAASAITVLTPTKTDDRLRRYLLAVLNFLALNIGNARNKDGEDG